MPGMGRADAQLMFVGEAPGRSEDFTGTPFVERDGGYSAGSLLSEVCRECDIDRRDVYITNVIKYRPPDNKLKRLHEIGVSIDDSISQLWDEIRAINPNCIVGFGNLPLRALFGKGNGFKGIMQWRGSVLPTVGMDYKGVPTIHPAALLHHDGELEDDDYPGKKKKGPVKYSYKHILKLDLLKAKKQSEFRSYNPPKRLLEIARDHIQLQRFFDQYKDKDLVSVDIEVLKSIPFCIAFAFNEWHAMSVPLLDVFSWQNKEGIHESVAAEMWRICAELLDSNIRVVGQNFKFDQGQLARLCGITIRNFYCDTSLLAHSLHPEFPKALGFITSIYTDEPFYKDEGKEFSIKRDDIDRYLTYNARDAAVTYECFAEMEKDAKELIVPGFPNWYNTFVLGHVMPLHSFYAELENVGFAVNHKRKQELCEIYDEKIHYAQLELDTLAGWQVNTSGSSKDPGKLVYEQLHYPFRKSTDEDTLYALIANHSTKHSASDKRCLELILHIRRLKLNRKKTFGAACDYDGRMRTIFTISGTETGRSNTKILQPPVRPDKLGMPFHTITKHGEIGGESREFLIADDGYVIVETDMSQAEARIVALLANDKRVLEIFRLKQDLHRITASWIFGGPPDKITKELRFIGKTCRHAGNYDMRKGRLAELVNTEAKKQDINIRLSEWKADIVLTKFHAFSPNVRKVFHEGIKAELERNARVLVNPFGRYRQFYDRWGHELWREAFAQIPQSTVPDQLRRAGINSKLRFAKEGVVAKFVVEAHDALVGLVREKDVDRYKEILHEEIERPIDFKNCSISRGLLSIPAESKVGYNYKECVDKNCKNPNCKFLHDYIDRRKAA